MKFGRPSNKKGVLKQQKSNTWDDADNEEREELRVRLIGENEDDEQIASDDDEEVESDAAFEESDESSDEESDEEGALEQLNDFVSNLDVTSRKRKVADNEVGASTDTPRKRRLVEERTEAGAENEFRARSSGIFTLLSLLRTFILTSGLTSGLKLNLDDLLAPLASHSSVLQSLKTSAKVLASSSSKAKTLSAPLPQRTQERLDRQAAYEKTKEEVEKWSETMKHIREVNLFFFFSFVLIFD